MLYDTFPLGHVDEDTPIPLCRLHKSLCSHMTPGGGPKSQSKKRKESKHCLRARHAERERIVCRMEKPSKRENETGSGLWRTADLENQEPCSLSFDDEPASTREGGPWAHEKGWDGSRGKRGRCTPQLSPTRSLDKSLMLATGTCLSPVASTAPVCFHALDVHHSPIYMQMDGHFVVLDAHQA